MTILDFANKLKKEESVAIFCHVRPDGDTLGSSLGVQRVLNSLGIVADVFCDDIIPEKFFFLPQVKNVKRNIEREYSAYFAMDCADVSRIGVFERFFYEKKNTYNFDHHISNTKYAKYNLVIEAPACAENCVDLAKALGVAIDEETANLLAMGLVTDSGNFRHQDVSSKTFFTAGELKKSGADFNKITYNNFTKQSKFRAKLFGETMSKIRYLLDDKLAIIVVTAKSVSDAGAKPEETEGFVDFVMGIDCVEVGVCIMETEGAYKASFRSKKADVNAVALKFGGGGHVLASGCRYNGNLEEFIDKIRYYVSQQIEE